MTKNDREHVPFHEKELSVVLPQGTAVSAPEHGHTVGQPLSTLVTGTWALKGGSLPGSLKAFFHPEILKCSRGS